MSSDVQYAMHDVCMFFLSAYLRMQVELCRLPALYPRREVSLSHRNNQPHHCTQRNKTQCTTRQPSTRHCNGRSTQGLLPAPEPVCACYKRSVH